MSSQYRRQHGFGLVEVLIGAVVVAIGLLAVAGLHTRLVGQSGDSKARAEAIALAQARIEDLRNYTNDLTSRAEFETSFAATAGFTNAATFDGVNATFTRSEAVGAVGDTRQVQVRVAWSDAVGAARDVTLATGFAWESPRAVGDIAKPKQDPLVSGPTGRARLGEGLLPDGEPTTPNGDTTEIYDDGTGNPKLVVDGRIVLTLLDACRADDGSCVDFVTINGRVYIDTATQNIEPGVVQVIASNASYCQRFYTAADGTVVAVTNDTTSTRLTTPDSDYEYFDYRCYMGGGWYGNIGILLADGLSQSDKVCQGDPVAGDAWKEPVIAARRSYRGMLYGVTPTGIELDADGDPVVYTIGIADSATLPDQSYPTWSTGGTYAAGDRVVYERYVYVARRAHTGSATAPSGDGWNWWVLSAHHTHDFVVSSLATSATEGSNCISQGVMVRPDSVVGGVSGALFEGVPTDFFCLNPDHTDAFGAQYVAPLLCPYSPVNGPAVRHVVSGSITVVGGADWIDAISVNTSDGPGNCVRSDFSTSGLTSVAEYTCDVYEWGGGWAGYVQTKPNSPYVSCTDGGLDGTTDNRLNVSGVSADTAGKNFECLAGSIAIFSGEITTSNQNRTLESAAISVTGGWCTVATDGLSYECTTGVFAGDTWTGTLTFTPGGGVMCGPGLDRSTGVVTILDAEPGEYTLNLGIVNNLGATCPY